MRLDRFTSTLFTFYLVLNGVSYHDDRNLGLNEANNIKGVEYQIRRTGYFAAFFKNSFNEDAIIVGINRKELCAGKLCVGYTGALLAGYDTIFDNKPFPVLKPYLTYEFDRFGFDLNCLPRVCVGRIKYDLNFDEADLEGLRKYLPEPGFFDFFRSN